MYVYMHISYPIRDDLRGEEPRGEGVPRLLHRAGSRMYIYIYIYI